MNGRVAFVTSGANGLGNAVVKAMLEAGWNVFFTYHTSREEAQSLVQYASGLGRQADTIQADLCDQRACETAVRACLQRFGKVDAFIHNFGPFVFERISLAEYSDERWSRMMVGNLSNFFWMYREVIPGMRERGFGRIVTVGYDGAGTAVGWRFRAAYAAAKAGLAALTRSAAREERQNGITANMVCPGDIRGQHKSKMIRDVESPYDLLGRPPVGEDVARTIVFLCQERSGQLNGTVTEVTGGYDVLAYDDGKEAVPEMPVHGVGDRVWVIPWQCEAEVTEVVKVPNRNVVYRVAAEDQKGSFTIHQLKPRV